MHSSWLLFKESYINPQFKGYSQNSGVSLDKIRRVLTNVSQGNRLQSNEYSNLKSLAAEIIAEQAACLYSVSVQSGFSEPVVSYPRSSSSKDVDACFIMYDFESHGKYERHHDPDEMIKIRREVRNDCRQWSTGLFSSFNNNLANFGYVNNTSTNKDDKNIVSTKVDRKLSKLIKI